jgi:hypothetical protein
MSRHHISQLTVEWGDCDPTAIGSDSIAESIAAMTTNSMQSSLTLLGALGYP